MSSTTINQKRSLTIHFLNATLGRDEGLLVFALRLKTSLKELSQDMKVDDYEALSIEKFRSCLSSNYRAFLSLQSHKSLREIALDADRPKAESAEEAW